MSELTATTRRESLETFDTEKLRNAVFGLICDHPEGVSPWQMYELLGRRHHVHAIRPRATELKKLGLIRVAGKRIGPTGKSEAYYIQAHEFDGNQGLLRMADNQPTLDPARNRGEETMRA